MQVFQITIRCTQQPLMHAKILRMDATLGRQYAESFAGLLDGSSPFYVYKPGPDSPIGRCALCGAPFTATVDEVEVKDKDHAKPEG